MAKLNAKQKKFVEAYLLKPNAKIAAMSAGYSQHTAAVQGAKLLNRPNVREEIEIGLEKQREDARAFAVQDILTKDRWLQELKIIALSNMDDYVTIETTNAKHGPTQYRTARPKLTRQRHRIFGRAIKKITETKNGIGIELHSKQAALELLGKHYGWVKNDFEVSNNNAVQVNLTMPQNGREASDSPYRPNEDLRKRATDPEVKITAKDLDKIK